MVDEYGDIQGLVTLEDILEEVVGDFTTTQTRPPSEEVNMQNDGTVMVEGSVNIRDLNKEMDWDLPTEGPKTLNGLIVEVPRRHSRRPAKLTCRQLPYGSS